MRSILLRILINAAALWAVASFIPGISFEGGLIGLLIIALVFGLVNLVVKPLINFLAFPFQFFTFGLFSVVINAAMLYLTAYLLENFKITPFWFPGINIGPVMIAPFYVPTLGTAIVGSLSISFISGVLHWLVRK